MPIPGYKPPEEPEKEGPPPVQEETAAWWARYNAAVAAGLTEDEALEFATNGEFEQLVKLVEAGCDARTIASIVA
jgi:hypothetical protein